MHSKETALMDTMLLHQLKGQNYVLYSSYGDFVPARDLRKHHPLIAERADFIEFETWSQARAILRSAPPMAIILPTSPELLRGLRQDSHPDDRAYLPLLRDCLALSRNNVYFRLYVYFHNMTDGDFERGYKTILNTLYDLSETLQIPSNLTGKSEEEARIIQFGNIGAGLLRFLNTPRHTPFHSVYRFAVLLIAIISNIMRFLPVLAILIIMVNGFEPGKLPDSVNQALAVGMGVLTVGLTLQTVADSSYQPLHIAFILWSIVFSFAMRVDVSWFLLGLLLGIPLDHYRRISTSILPIRLPLSPPNIFSNQNEIVYEGEQPVLRWSYESVDDEMLRKRNITANSVVSWRQTVRQETFFRGIHGFASSFMDSRALWIPEPQVFISYKKKGWANKSHNKFPEKLHVQLEKSDLRSFLDISDLQLGSSWLAAIETAVQNCTLFVLFAEEEMSSVHAGELRAAIRLQYKTGLPRIVDVINGQERFGDTRNRILETIAFDEAHFEQFTQELAERTLRSYVLQSFRGNLGSRASRIIYEIAAGMTAILSAFAARIWILIAVIAVIGNILNHIQLEGTDFMKFVAAVLWLSAGFHLQRATHNTLETLETGQRALWKRFFPFVCLSALALILSQYVDIFLLILFFSAFLIGAWGADVGLRILKLREFAQQGSTKGIQVRRLANSSEPLIRCRNFIGTTLAGLIAPEVLKRRLLSNVE